MKISVPVFTHARAAIWYLSTKMKRAGFVGNIINSVRIAGRGLSGRTDMQELEKILEEIDIKIAGSMGKKREGLLGARKIICKHINDGWIPMEERLPEESLNSVIGWDEYRERCCFVQYYGGRWILGADREPIHIIAWRPLPGPYRPERRI